MVSPGDRNCVSTVNAPIPDAVTTAPAPPSSSANASASASRVGFPERV